MADEREFGGRRFMVDRDTTARAYQLAEGGGSETCVCNGCRNFRIARDRVFPADFLALLSDLGIDPRKDAEVVHYGANEPGMHMYDGWFHFLGTLAGNGASERVQLGDGFSVWLTDDYAPGLKSLAGQPSVQVSFWTESVPWMLDEPEPR